MLTKRQKIAISSVILAAGIFFLPKVTLPDRFYFLAAIILASYLLSIWSIYGQFSALELITLFVLPVILTTSFGLFQARFEQSFSVRFILALVYIVAMYTILLSENIFNVSVERNIPLVRAARTVGYLATLFVAFAFFTFLFGLRIPLAAFSFLVWFVSTLLFAQGFWQIKLKGTNFLRLFYLSSVAGFLVGEIALVLGFWPLSPPKVGLVLTAAIYLLLGILQHHLKESLSQRVVLEYLFETAALILFLLVSTSWGV